MRKMVIVLLMVFTCFFVSDTKLNAQNSAFDKVMLRVGDVYDYPMDLRIVHILGNSVLYNNGSIAT